MHPNLHDCDWYVIGNVPHPHKGLRRVLRNRHKILCLSHGSAAGINLLELILACINANKFVSPECVAGVSVGALVSVAVATSFPLNTMTESYAQILGEVISLNRIAQWRRPMDMEALEAVIFNKILGLWVSNLQKFRSDLDRHSRQWIKNSTEAQWETIRAQTPEVFVLVTDASNGVQRVCALGLKHIVSTVQWGLDDATEQMMRMAARKVTASMSLPAPASNPVHIQGASDLPDGWYSDGALSNSGPFPIDLIREGIIATDTAAANYDVLAICCRSLKKHPGVILNTLGPVCMRLAGTHKSIIRATVEIDERMMDLPNVLARVPVTALALVPGNGREEIPVHSITPEQGARTKRLAERFSLSL